MTTIVGMTTPTETVLMVDSRLSIGNLREVSFSKLFTNNVSEGVPLIVPTFAIAAAGRSHSHQLVFNQLSDEMQPLIEARKVPWRPDDLAFDIALMARTILRRQGIDLHQAEFLLALPGHLYAFNDTGDVHIPSRGYHAGGSGEGYALGAMCADDLLMINGTTGVKPPLYICANAMRVAAELDLYTSGPFYWAHLTVDKNKSGTHLETGEVTA